METSKFSFQDAPARDEKIIKKVVARQTEQGSKHQAKPIDRISFSLMLRAVDLEGKKKVLASLRKHIEDHKNDTPYDNKLALVLASIVDLSQKEIQLYEERQKHFKLREQTYFINAKLGPGDEWQKLRPENERPKEKMGKIVVEPKSTEDAKALATINKRLAIINDELDAFEEELFIRYPADYLILEQNLQGLFENRTN